jgi:hypothetical protein
MSPKENLSRRLEKLERDTLDVGEPPPDVWIESKKRDWLRRDVLGARQDYQWPIPDDSPELEAHDRRVLEQRERALRARGVVPPSPEEAEALRKQLLEMLARKDEEVGCPDPPLS